MSVEAVTTSDDDMLAVLDKIPDVTVVSRPVIVSLEAVDSEEIAVEANDVLGSVIEVGVSVVTDETPVSVDIEDAVVSEVDDSVAVDDDIL